MFRHYSWPNWKWLIKRICHTLANPRLHKRSFMFWKQIQISIGACKDKARNWTVRIKFRKFHEWTGTDFRTFGKRGTPLELKLPYCSASFDFGLGIFRIFGWLVRVSRTWQFSDLPENFRNIRSHVEISRNSNQPDCGADFGKAEATSTFLYFFHWNYPPTKSEYFKIRNVETASSFAVLYLGYPFQTSSTTYFVE